MRSSRLSGVMPGPAGRNGPRPPAGSDHRHGYRRRGCRGRPPAPDPVRPVRLRRLPAVCASPGARRRGREPLSAGRGGHHRGARPHPGTSRQGARSRLRRGRAARDRDHRRERVHRMHGVHPRVPGGRDHRGAQVDARGAGERMHGLRSVRRAVPGGLHLDGPGACRPGDARGVAGRARAARAAAVRAPPATGIGVRRGAAPPGAGRAGSMPPNPCGRAASSSGGPTSPPRSRGFEARKAERGARDAAAVPPARQVREPGCRPRHGEDRR